jgi:hypothetical protein
MLVGANSRLQIPILVNLQIVRVKVVESERGRRRRR